MRKLCRTLGVARSAYYAAEQKPQRPRAHENAGLVGKLSGLFEASACTYGSPRLTAALRRGGARCERRRVARLMRGAGLRAKQKRRFRPRTTDSRHLCPIAPNHLATRVEPPSRPNEVWQVDITYIATHEGWLYLAGVLDACRRKIVGLVTADTMLPGRAARSRIASPLRPGQSVRQRCRPRSAAPPRNDPAHEPSGQLGGGYLTVAACWMARL